MFTNNIYLGGFFMKSISKKIISFMLLFTVVLATQTVDAASRETVSQSEGTYIGSVDYGDGFVGYEYVSYVDSLSAIQPRTATLGSGSKLTEVYQGGSYCFTIHQYATFVYGSPDAVVRIKSKSASLYSYNSASPYRVGTISSTSVDGSPAYVKSSFGIYKTSDSSLARNASCIMYCKDSGLVE